MSKKYFNFIGLLLVVGLLFAAVPNEQVEANGGTTINIGILDPGWTAPGGGGVFAAYYGPPSYPPVVPGSTALYDGREAGIIKAGIAPDLEDGHYWDEGILAFKVNNVSVSAFATQTLSYEVQNETGTNPVWVRIRIVGGTTFQYLPSSYGVGGGYHVIDAAAGLWQLMDKDGNATGPEMTLAQLAVAYPEALVDRVYLTLGMGDSYNVGPGVGTVGWVDKVIIDTVTYDFVVIPTSLCTTDCYVDAAYGNDTFPGTADFPFKTIQKGIDTVTAGGIVHVAAGTYVESKGGWRDLEIFKSLSLIGAGSGQTIVKFTNLQHGLDIHPDTTGTVLVEGITFTKQDANVNSAGFAVLVGETGGTFQKITFKDVEIAYASGRNLQFNANATYNEIVIENSNIHHSDIWGACIAGPTNKLTVTNSDFTFNGKNDPGHGYGLDLNSSSIRNVAVTGGHFDDNYGPGININSLTEATFDGVTASRNGQATAMHNGAVGVNLWDFTGTGSNNVVFKNSTFADNKRAGIVLGNQDAITTGPVTIESSTIIGNGRYGLIFWDTTSAVTPWNSISVHHNRIIHTGTDITLLGNHTSGISLENNWWGCNEGFGQPGCSGGAWAAAGTFTVPNWLQMNVSTTPVFTPGATSTFTADLTENNVPEDTSAEGYLPPATITFTPADNVDPDTGVLASGVASTFFSAPIPVGSLDVCSQLDNETVCLPYSHGTPTVIFADDTWIGLPDGTAVTPAYPVAAGTHYIGYDAFETVQEAIDAVAAGGTVYVQGGNYTEQVTIAKAISLLGAGDDITTIKAFASMPTCFTTLKVHKPLVCVLNTTATIDGFTLDGLGLGNSNVNFEGVAFRNSDGTLQNSTIKDIRNTPFDGGQHGVAVYVYNDDLTARTVHVLDNVITGFQKNAMALNASLTNPLTVDVQRNVITGAGPTTVTAQNGIQVDAAAGGGLVKDNTISGITYDGSDWVATSILNYYSNLQTIGNVITDAHMGIYYVDAPGLIDGNSLSIIEGAGYAYGIYANDPPRAIPSPYEVDGGKESLTGIKNSINVGNSVEISDNTVSLAIPWTNSIGIEVDGGYSAIPLAANVHNNTVAGFDYGLMFYQCDPADPNYGAYCVTGGSLTGITVEENVLDGNATGLYLGGPISVEPTIYRNKFLGYTYGIYNDLTGEVNAEFNYWGSACGPVATAIVGLVDYNPWYTDAAMTKTSDVAATYDFAAGTSTEVINATIACAANGSTFNFLPGNHFGDIKVPQGKDNMTLKLKDGAKINANSPCFTVEADYTTITGESFLGAVCYPTAGDHGIYVKGTNRNLTLARFEIDGAGVGQHGVYFDDVITDVVIADLYIHDMLGDGINFAAQPVELTVGAIDIHGNMFRDNDGVGVTNPNGTAAIDLTYNSWGSLGGPNGTGGDGVGTGVTFEPWTHLDLFTVSSTTPWPNQVVKGQTITYTVKANLRNVNAADFTLIYPANLTYLSSAASGTFDAEMLTPGTNSINFQAVNYTDNVATTADTLPLFTVTFTAGSPVVEAPMDLDDTTDGFGMVGVGSSSNVYAYELVDGTVTIIDLPTMDILPQTPGTPAECIAGIPCPFIIQITNPATGGVFGPEETYLNFTLPTAGTILERWNGTSWVVVTSPTVIGALDNDLVITPLFRVTFDTPGATSLTFNLMDPNALPDPTDFQLATATEPFNVLGNFSVTGTLSMQGRTFRGGIVMTLTDVDGAPVYTPAPGTSINQISNNVTVVNVNGSYYRITTTQARYLDLIAANQKIILVNGDKVLNPLQLRGGDVAKNNWIYLDDAAVVGTAYGSTGDPLALPADVNFDGKVNIQDLALVGGNYDLTSEEAYGIGSMDIWFPTDSPTDLDAVVAGTTITGSVTSGIVATFPVTIPASIVAEPYKINSQIILGEALPAGTLVSVSYNGSPVLSNAPLTGTGPFWITDLIGAPASNFDAGYGGLTETWVITITGNSTAIDTTLTINSIISRDGFTSELIKLDEATLGLVVPAP